MVTDAGEARYAEHGDAHLAFRTWGEGPPLLYVTSQFIPITAIDEEPAHERFIARLAEFATVIAFDRAGIGWSDPIRDDPTIEDWAAQLASVLDAAGFDSAFILSTGRGFAASVQLAVARPERVRGLVVALAVGTTGMPVGVTPEDVVASARPSPQGTSVDFVRLLAPSRANDLAFRRWWDSAGRRGASPAVAQRLLAFQGALDASHLLPEVRVPTLVIDRPRARAAFGDAPPIGAEIAGARVVEVEGVDLLVWLPDSDTIVAEIEDFMTGERRPAPLDRRLLTMMFTDIVGSTTAAARLGDDRWRDVLESHDRLMRLELERHGATQIDTAGDGCLSTFQTPSAAVHCARRLHRAMADLDIELRIGIHCGEVETRGSNVAGIGVHVAARVESSARPGETWVTSTVREAMTGSDLSFEERGPHELKGVPGTWRLYALTGG